MRISRILLRGAAFLCLCLAAACGNKTVSQPAATDKSGTDVVAKSTLARNTNPEVSAEDLAAAVSGSTQVALKIFPLLDSAPNTNTFFSPYSITQAFLLLAPGANGTTLSEIEQTMGFSLPQSRLNAAFNKLNLMIADSTTGGTLSSGRTAPKLNNANAVWGQKGFNILPSYLDTLALNYGAGLHQVDFATAAESSRQTINNWVAAETGDRIRDLIPTGGISSNTRLVLTNAVWFKAEWASTFAQEDTLPEPFYNRDGSMSSILFMRKTFSVPYAAVNGCEAVDIPYVGDKLSMLVMMPAPGTFDTFVSSLTPTALSAIINELQSAEINFLMPKFSFTKPSAMTSILQSLGMVQAFEPSHADFSGIDGARDLALSDVYHKAFISVNEDGTEAAAATAIGVGVTWTQDPSGTLPTVAIDHPFIFAIRDRQSGLILFMGKIVSSPPQS